MYIRGLIPRNWPRQFRLIRTYWSFDSLHDVLLLGLFVFCCCFLFVVDVCFLFFLFFVFFVVFFGFFFWGGGGGGVCHILFLI